MRTILSASVLILIFCACIFAQSGRRIKPTPTPTPDPNAEPNYSESIPRKKRERIMPSFRNPEGVMQTEVYQSKPLGNTTDADDPDAVLKVETTLITIPVSVFDRNGLYKTGLEKHNFTIFEGGKPQEIAYYVPGAPKLSPAGAIQMNDVWVDENRIIYSVDRFAGGLYILEMTV